jgi:quinoprotein glucose dehydrogenase
MKKTALLLAPLMLGATLLPSHAAGPSTEWPTYGNDKGGMRYSPLTQITPANVAKLEKAWTFNMRPAYLDNPAANPTAGRGGRGGAAAGRGGRGFTPPRFLGSQMTPLVANGLMFLATPYRRVTALNAETGKQVWAYDLPGTDAPSTRGVEYWPGGNGAAPRVIVSTRDGKIIALSARTGEPVASFGTNGILDTKTPEIMNGLPNAAFGYSTPPLVVNNVLVTGGRVQEQPTKGASGDVRGWDIRTGKLLWTFHTVPRPGEKGNETWGNDSWQQRSGVNIWTYIVADAARDIVYLPIGAPAFDRWGGDRPGTNLYSDSVVAVNAKTGKYLWHFQTVHHDIWDVDLPGISLIEVKRNGKTIPGVAVMNKMAILFMFNRVTGEPLYEITEKPVPTNTDIPDEKPWPTQPFSVTPPLGKLSWQKGDISDVTPEHKAWCEKFVADKNALPAEPFQPLRVDGAVVSFPGSLGGVDWGGQAFDPKRGLLIVNTNNLAHFSAQEKRADGSYGMKDGYQYFWNSQTRMPCQSGPWGQFNAVDVNTGKIVWQVPLGITEELPADKQKTGRVGLGNPMVTASGLAFVGATDDYRLRAFDSATGKELWVVKLAGGVNSGPITWRGKSGRQYVTAVATGGANAPATSDEVVTFALPK